MILDLNLGANIFTKNVTAFEAGYTLEVCCVASLDCTDAATKTIAELQTGWDLVVGGVHDGQYTCNHFDSLQMRPTVNNGLLNSWDGLTVAASTLNIPEAAVGATGTGYAYGLPGVGSTVAAHTNNDANYYGWVTAVFTTTISDTDGTLVTCTNAPVGGSTNIIYNNGKSAKFFGEVFDDEGFVYAVDDATGAQTTRIPVTGLAMNDAGVGYSANFKRRAHTEYGIMENGLGVEVTMTHNCNTTGGDGCIHRVDRRAWSWCHHRNTVGRCARLQSG